MVVLQADQSIRWKERIGIMVIGHTFKQFEENVFAYVLYPLAIAALGGVVGGLVMTVSSALECWIFIRLYDWSKKDWLGLELIKEARDGEEGYSRMPRFVHRIARKSDWLAFLVMSFTTDPFMTTVYLRKGIESYNGMLPRDWRIFWASVVVGNIGWTVVVTSAIAGFRFVFRWLGLI
jgi:hypothetical protein